MNGLFHVSLMKSGNLHKFTTNESTTRKYMRLGKLVICQSANLDSVLLWAEV